LEKNIKFPIRLSNVNTTDLELAIRDGCLPMQLLFDPEHEGLPYFGNLMSGENPLNYHHSNFSISHVPGRWLNALLNAEDVLNISLKQEALANLTKWAKLCNSHPMGLSQSIDLETFQPIPVSDFHNLRESTHALYALAKYRNDKEAAALAKRQLLRVTEYLDFTSGEWNEERFQRDFSASTTCTCLSENEKRTFPISFGRYIGPLVKLYKATDMEEALQLAIRLKNYAFEFVLNEEGQYNVLKFGSHTHSTTAMISSLAQLGEVLNDASIFQRIIAFMQNGLSQIAIGELGWCIENYTREDHYGEINNTSDIMETCLILGKQGHTSYFQQAERILRSHFLPSQLRDCSFIPEWDVPDEAFHHKLRRAYGAFGFPCPYGHEYEEDGWISFNWDIVGGGVGGLCEAYRDKLTKSSGLYSVNLHFDHQDEDVEVISPYTNADVMDITVKRPATIRVRLSDWVVRGELEIKSAQSDIHTEFSDDWLYIFGMQENSKIHIRFPMHIETKEYAFGSNVFTFRWRGDSVEAADNLGRRLCFFSQI
jgi:hypothetical protein